MWVTQANGCCEVGSAWQTRERAKRRTIMAHPISVAMAEHGATLIEGRDATQEPAGRNEQNGHFSIYRVQK